MYQKHGGLNWIGVLHLVLFSIFFGPMFSFLILFYAILLFKEKV